MKNITVAGRFLFALPLALFGINHFLMLDYYLGMLTSFIPFGAYSIVLTGLMLIAVSISIMTRWYVKQAAYTLAILLLIFILAIHVPHLLSSVGDERTVVLIALLKDISLMGASLMIAGVCQERNLVKT
jgi:putative oxidoreductase